MTSHYLNPWWPRLLTNICVTRLQWLKARCATTVKLNFHGMGIIMLVKWAPGLVTYHHMRTGPMTACERWPDHSSQYGSHKTQPHGCLWSILSPHITWFTHQFENISLNFIQIYLHSDPMLSDLCHYTILTGSQALILGLRPANEICRYKVTGLSLAECKPRISPGTSCLSINNFVL